MSTVESQSEIEVNEVGDVPNPADSDNTIIDTGIALTRRRFFQGIAAVAMLHGCNRSQYGENLARNARNMQYVEENCRLGDCSYFQEAGDSKGRRVSKERGISPYANIYIPRLYTEFDNRISSLATAKDSSGVFDKCMPYNFDLTNPLKEPLSKFLRDYKTGQTVTTQELISQFPFQFNKFSQALQAEGINHGTFEQHSDLRKLSFVTTERMPSFGVEQGDFVFNQPKIGLVITVNKDHLTGKWDNPNVRVFSEFSSIEYLPNGCRLVKAENHNFRVRYSIGTRNEKILTVTTNGVGVQLVEIPPSRLSSDLMMRLVGDSENFDDGAVLKGLSIHRPYDWKARYKIEPYLISVYSMIKDLLPELELI